MFAIVIVIVIVIVILAVALAILPKQGGKNYSKQYLKSV
jgi:hypothetical protein